jgi:hypothetical protein
MDIETIFGITWRKASGGDIALIILLIAVPVVLLLAVAVVRRMRYRRIHDSQLFLFRLRRLGLSNFQIKIVNNIIGILGFSNPLRLLEKQEFFEDAVARLLDHARETGEDGESQCTICRDITIIYDKLYSNMQFKSPIRGVKDLDETQLIYCVATPRKVLLGKIVSWDGRNLYMKVFGGQGSIAGIAFKGPVRFFIFRLGDAEYEFTSSVAGREGSILLVEIPREIRRLGESRHPYIDVILPAELWPIEEQAHPASERDAGVDAASPGETGEYAGNAEAPRGDETGEDAGQGNVVKEGIPCTIYKINNYEAVIRVGGKLDFRRSYHLDFTVLDFKVRIQTRIIATRTVEEAGTFYYTLKFDTMSEGANNVVKKYVYEHL